MNKAHLVGNLTRDVELKFTNGGKAVAKFTIAVNRDGSKDKVDFPSITVWGKSAENCAKYLSKGSKVGVIGSVNTSSYKGSDDKMKYVTDILASKIDFLSTKGVSSETNSEYQSDDFQAIEDDSDIPF